MVQVFEKGLNKNAIYYRAKKRLIWVAGALSGPRRSYDKPDLARESASWIAG